MKSMIRFFQKRAVAFVDVSCAGDSGDSEMLTPFAGIEISFGFQRFALHLYRVGVAR